jgi:iron complex transport system ATP-binding protein
MTSLISVRDLSFSYTRDMAQAVFRQAEFSIGPGDIFCLLGRNGTGKSTLLKCVINVLQGWQGSILLAGKPLSTMRPSEAAKGIGYVPQNQVSAFPFLVKDIVVMGRAPHLNVFSAPSKRDRLIAGKAMETTGILALADRPCTTLSGGEWQLTLIARALTQEPQVMVLDEPTSHLDLGNQMKVLRVVKSLAERGLGILMASHFPDHAFVIATQVSILDRGQIVHKGTPDEVITDETMGKTYGVDVRVLHIGEGVDRKACFPLFSDTSAAIRSGEVHAETVVGNGIMPERARARGESR